MMHRAVYIHHEEIAIYRESRGTIRSIRVYKRPSHTADRLLNMLVANEFRLVPEPVVKGPLHGVGWVISCPKDDPPIRIIMPFGPAPEMGVTGRDIDGETQKGETGPTDRGLEIVSVKPVESVEMRMWALGVDYSGLLHEHFEQAQRYYVRNDGPFVLLSAAEFRETLPLPGDTRYVKPHMNVETAPGTPIESKIYRGFGGDWASRFRNTGYSKLPRKTHRKRRRKK